MDLLQRARELSWYHTIEIAPGETTKGWFDLRPYLPRYGLPERMEGMRALDVGTWDGFWAFEMERRGAQVVALDLDDEAALDWPPRRRPKAFRTEKRGQGFRVAHELLDSKVERIVCSIYDAKPEDLGRFDFVFCGSVLMHLRDQMLALERMAGLCRGTLVSAEEFDRLSGLVPFPVARYRADRDADVIFWQPAAGTWKRMIWGAGFDGVVEHGRFSLKSTQGFSVRHVVHHATGPAGNSDSAPASAEQP